MGLLVFEEPDPSEPGLLLLSHTNARGRSARSRLPQATAAGVRWHAVAALTFEHSLEVVRHIDELVRITGSHRHVALGTDFDGCIKPTMTGLESMAALNELERETRGPLRR